ncbi:mesoderm posterior protein 1-like [Pezoporus flaviventris]|uniref:mesoderm posterior protein 1-like n=1 Tax=Pezoporus flaviventris TaxID=889875 RepID=UPI002AB1A202|nr:mesoderm posterior protein 1-like [Pezoporus flaviventris]
MAAPGLPLPPTSLLQHWGCRGPPDPEGYSSSSPAASPDSCGLSSPAAARGPRSGPAAPRGPRGRKGARGAGGPRQSASEREKLRMRRLAQALLRLRHYLPPALAPAGQSLTKIETLRLAARYIAHLSALLGLSEEALARRRGTAPRHCPLCPQGLGCCRSPDPRPLPPAPAPRDASPPGAAGWGSPPVAGPPPGLLGAAGVGPGAWGSSPPCGAAAGPPPEVLGVPDLGPGAWGSPPYIPSVRTPPELYGSAVTSDTCSWPSPLHGAGAPPDLPGDPLLDAGLMLPEFVDAGTVTQDLSADLLSLLEALLPSQRQD